MPRRASGPRRRGSARLVLVATSAAAFTATLDNTVVAVALRDLQRDLGAGVTGLQGVVTAYTVALAALLLTGGALVDTLGARRVLLAGLAVFGLASLGCALSTTVVTLVACRAAQGAGAALLLPGGLAVLAASYPDPVARRRAVGVWAGVGGSALVAGPVVGGCSSRRTDGSRSSGSTRRGGGGPRGGRPDAGGRRDRPAAGRDRHVAHARRPRRGDHRGRPVGSPGPIRRRAGPARRGRRRVGPAGAGRAPGRRPGPAAGPRPPAAVRRGRAGGLRRLAGRLRAAGLPEPVPAAGPGPHGASHRPAAAPPAGGRRPRRAARRSVAGDRPTRGRGAAAGRRRAARAGDDAERSHRAAAPRAAACDDRSRRGPDVGAGRRRGPGGGGTPSRRAGRGNGERRPRARRGRGRGGARCACGLPAVGPAGGRPGRRLTWAAARGAGRPAQWPHQRRTAAAPDRPRPGPHVGHRRSDRRGGQRVLRRVHPADARRRGSPAAARRGGLRAAPARRPSHPPRRSSATRRTTR